MIEFLVENLENIQIISLLNEPLSMVVSLLVAAASLKYLLK